MQTDCLGNAVVLDDPASLDLFNDFVEGFIACEARVANVLQLSERDDSPMVQASCAALHMFAESAEAPANATPFIERALQSAPHVSEREQGFVAAVAAWVVACVVKSVMLMLQMRTM